MIRIILAGNVRILKSLKKTEKNLEKGIDREGGIVVLYPSAQEKGL